MYSAIEDADFLAIDGEFSGDDVQQEFLFFSIFMFLAEVETEQTEMLCRLVCVSFRDKRRS